MNLHVKKNISKFLKKNYSTLKFNMKRYCLYMYLLKLKISKKIIETFSLVYIHGILPNISDTEVRDRPFNLQGGGYGFSFRSKFFFRTTRKLEFFFLLGKARNFFPEFNIRLYDKNSESYYFFFLHQNQNIFLEKSHNPYPPPHTQVKWPFPKYMCI